MTPPVPTEEDRLLAIHALERARLKAAINVEDLLEKLTSRGLDPSASFKSVLDSFEANYKVSGLAAKQAAQASIPVSVRINLNTSKAGLTLDAEVVAESDALSEPPVYMVPNFVSNLDELRCDVDE